MLLNLQPLLFAQLHSPFFHRVLASDASELAAGVVASPLSFDLQRRIEPFCSSRRMAALQTQLTGKATEAILCRSIDGSAGEDDLGALHRLAECGSFPPSIPDVSSLRSCVAGFADFYSAVSSSRWSTLISFPWRDDSEHINALELRAALLAVHWCLSFPSSLNSRVFLLLDSSVALFSLWKGRSSSPPLLFVLRKISALLLAGGISLLCGWIPSEVNPADGPSRQVQQKALVRSC